MVPPSIDSNDKVISEGMLIDSLYTTGSLSREFAGIGWFEFLWNFVLVYSVIVPLDSNSNSRS